MSISILITIFNLIDIERNLLNLFFSKNVQEIHKYNKSNTHT
jgi:hypothetical protein